jgi:hypothetical protein
MRITGRYLVGWVYQFEASESIAQKDYAGAVAAIDQRFIVNCVHEPSIESTLPHCAAKYECIAATRPDQSAGDKTLLELLRLPEVIAQINFLGLKTESRQIVRFALDTIPTGLAIKEVHSIRDDDRRRITVGHRHQLLSLISHSKRG